MKKGILFLVISLFTTIAYPQTFTPVSTSFPGLIYSSAAWGDYDNDGDLDLLILGKDIMNFDDMTIAYRNDGNGVFTNLNLALPIYWDGTCNWVDYDGDKDLDMFISGHPAGSTGPSNAILRNDGNDVFVNINFQGSGSDKSHYVDIDNDGDIDIGILGGGLNFLLNDGNGNYNYFNSGIYTPVQEFCFPDVDNDGDADVFMYMTSDYSVNTKLFINNGDLTFSESTNQFVQLKSSSAAWGDLDNDGDLDLVMSGDASTTLSTLDEQALIYENNGGNFTQVADTLADLNFSATLLADFDNDGDLDIFLSGELTFNSDSAYVYLNNGSFSFTPIAQQFSWHSNGSFSITDFDADNDIDIFTLGSLYGSSPSEFYRNDIAVANTAPNPPTTISSTIINDKLILGWDAGSDAETDTLGLSYNVEIFNLASGKYIVVPMSDSLTGNRLVLDRGNAQQALTKTYNLNNFDVGPCQVRVQSIDHCYKGSAFSTSVGVVIPPTSPFITDKDNLPVNDTLLVTYIGNCDTSAIYTWDFDSAVVISGSGMGPYQLTWASQGSKIISLEVTQNGMTSSLTTQFVSVGQAFVSISTSIIPLNNSIFEWGDYDNDDDLDIIYSGEDSQDNKYFQLWRNDGSDQFALVPTSIEALHVTSLNWGDYNNDGLLDILVTGEDTSSVTKTIIYINEGNDNFSELTCNLVFPAWSISVWEDVDNDGDLDVIISPSNYGKVYKNIGYGIFEEQIFAFGGYANYASNCFDFNNDGYQDLLSSQCLMNDGNYNFTVIYCGLPAMVNATRWGDFNNDGWMDFFGIGLENDYRNDIYENDGNGGFTVTPITMEPFNMQSDLNLGDYDNDGDLDLLVAGKLTYPFVVHSLIRENKGNYQFDEVNMMFPYSITRHLRWVDYDHDGDLDFTSSGNGGTNQYYFNIYRNEIDYANQKPEPPTNLSTDLINGNILEVSWDMATDLETNDSSLTYNFYLYKVGGDTIFTSHANINTGFKKLVGYGNMGFRRQFSYTSTEIGEYRWSVQSVDNNFEGSAFAPEQSVTVVGIDEVGAAGHVQLFQNSPNPFSGKTNIGFYLPQSDDIELSLYDSQGKLIQVLASDRFEKGKHSIEFNSGDLAIGSYYYSLKTGNGSVSRKMVVGE